MNLTSVGKTKKRWARSHAKDKKLKDFKLDGCFAASFYPK